jgi:hypothetical protein
MAGEINSYVLFLADVLLGEPVHSAWITPIDWLFRRSLAGFRQRLAGQRRLEQLTVLRKGVFREAPDIIPARITFSRGERPQFCVRRTGFAAPLPLQRPLPVAECHMLDADDWAAMPYASTPLCRSRALSDLARRWLSCPTVVSDPRRPREQRLLHIGDGIYKTRLKGKLRQQPAGLAVLTRASEVSRYHMAPAASWLGDSDVALTEGERQRFGAAKLVLHALKKASAPRRLAAALHDATDGPLALTNNFLVATAVGYAGDMAYPLALINSRLINRLYSEHFPGVNIEAYTLGLMPMPWPFDRGNAPSPPCDAGDVEAWHAWSLAASAGAMSLTRSVYQALCDDARRLCGDPGDGVADLRIEAVLGGLFGVSFQLVMSIWKGNGVLP